MFSKKVDRYFLNLEPQLWEPHTFDIYNQKHNKRANNSPFFIEMEDTKQYIKKQGKHKPSWGNKNATNNYQKHTLRLRTVSSHIHCWSVCMKRWCDGIDYSCFLLIWICKIATSMGFRIANGIDLSKLRMYLTSTLWVPDPHYAERKIMNIDKAQWLASCGHVSASSQSLHFILSLRLFSSFITSSPDVSYQGTFLLSSANYLL